MKELIAIQTRLAAPKDKRNDFGKFNYRTAESILRALKPLLKETGCVLTLSDEIVEMHSPCINSTSQSHRTYVRSTATLTNSEGKSISTTAYAREPLAKTGMDEAQVTGAASSYARKYALCGLLAIDDSTHDPDTKAPEPAPSANAQPSANAPTLSAALEAIEGAKTLEQLSTLHKRHPDLHPSPQFMQALTAKRKKIEGKA